MPTLGFVLSVAVTVTVKGLEKESPLSMVPEITPVAESTVNPAGRLIAPYHGI